MGLAESNNLPTMQLFQALGSYYSMLQFPNDDTQQS
jgi:hypothetical protein